jgi:hypothetical protein
MKKLLAILFLARPFCASAQPPTTHLVPKLVGTGAVGGSYQGFSVSLSGDGKTALVGGWADDGSRGAAWVFIRVDSTWTQQGPKLVGSDAVNSPSPARQGYSVALSADGNTALVGGRDDNGLVGAAWVFVRNAGLWTQQGAKLVAVGGGGPGGAQGYSVALSADGNTAMVGAPGFGEVWVYTRSAGVWSQQGGTLQGSAAVPALWGHSLALSADGNTALLGGYVDGGQAGSAWVYTRNGGVWSQQGPKLVGTGAFGNAQQGYSVSLSADGNTALVGGNTDNGNLGAAWVWTRSGGTWSQQGSKLVGTGAVGASEQGWSVSLSANGNIGVVGGYLDNSATGAAWVWTRSGTTWTQFGAKRVGTGVQGVATQGSSVSLSADGNAVLIGGYNDNATTGAAWVFGKSVDPVPNLKNKADHCFYPSPISRGQLLTLVLPNCNSSTSYSIEFLDLSGRVVLTQRGGVASGVSEELMISVSSLASGTYLARYTTCDRTQTCRVLIKE